MYVDDIVVRYADDENDEIGISSQADLNHAYQVSVSVVVFFVFVVLAFTHLPFLSQLKIVKTKQLASVSNRSSMKLIIRNLKGQLLAEPTLSIDLSST